MEVSASLTKNRKPMLMGVKEPGGAVSASRRGSSAAEGQGPGQKLQRQARNSS